MTKEIFMFYGRNVTKQKKNCSNPSNIKRVTVKYHMNVTNLVKIRHFHNLPIFMDLCTEI